MEKYFLYLAVWIFLFWVFSQTHAAPPLNHYSCERSWIIKSVEFQLPEIEECVTDTTFWCWVIAWWGYEGPIIPSRYIISIDADESVCIDKYEATTSSSGLIHNIRLDRSATWTQPKVWDSISWIGSHNTLYNIKLNNEKLPTYREKWGSAKSIKEKLEEKYDAYNWETPTWVRWNTKVEEINDKLLVFTSRLPQEKINPYIRATERMLRNSRFKDIYSELLLLRHHLYNW